MYAIRNDDDWVGSYPKTKFEVVEEIEKKKVLEIEFQDVFDKVAWRITYQNTNILERGILSDKEIGVISRFTPYFCEEILYIQGMNDLKDNEMNIVSKEEAKLIKQKVDAINKKYGISKKWRAEKGGVYFFVTSWGEVICGTDSYLEFDDLRYEYGNYFKTEEGALSKLDRIKPIFAE